MTNRATTSVSEARLVSAGEVAEIPRYEANRGPGSTADVDFWTSRDVREVVHCHLNERVADDYSPVLVAPRRAVKYPIKQKRRHFGRKLRPVSRPASEARDAHEARNTYLKEILRKQPAAILLPHAGLCPARRTRIHPQGDHRRWSSNA